MDSLVARIACNHDRLQPNFKLPATDARPDDSRAMVVIKRATWKRKLAKNAAMTRHSAGQLLFSMLKSDAE